MSQRKQRKIAREHKNIHRGNVIFFEHEGLTEKNYLQKLHQIIRESNSDISFEYGKGGGKDPITCVKNLIAQKVNFGRDGDLFIAVCDVDNFNEKEKSGKKTVLQQAIDIAKQNDIKLLISNICFEQWLEFHRSDNRYYKNQSTKKDLSKLLKDRLFIQNNINSAYRVAKNLDNLKEEYPKKYGSRVWQLFEILEENFPDCKILKN